MAEINKNRQKEMWNLGLIKPRKPGKYPSTISIAIGYCLISYVIIIDHRSVADMYHVSYTFLHLSVWFK